MACKLRGVSEGLVADATICLSLTDNRGVPAAEVHGVAGPGTILPPALPPLLPNGETVPSVGERTGLIVAAGRPVRFAVLPSATAVHPAVAWLDADHNCDPQPIAN